MRLFNAPLAALVAAAGLGKAADIDGASLNMTGLFHQTYSSTYVQSTSEIDWKCVKVHVTPTPRDPAWIEIYKEAHLHGGPATVTTPVQLAQLNGSSFTITTRGIMSPTRVRTYDVHAYTNDTYVITGKDDPALYVWTRANSTDEPVDIARLSAYVDELGFDVPDPMYRNITPTYNPKTCSGV